VATASKQPARTVFTLKIELVDSQPLIWRRIVISGHASFAVLHHVIQAAMGWHDAHLHEFRVGEQSIGVPDPEYDNPDRPTAIEKNVRLNRLLGSGTTFTYLYDFGDRWKHRLSVEQVKDVGDRYGDGCVARVESGARACPPEDAGGIAAYQDFLARWEHDPYGEQTEDVRTWAGLDFDPARFDRPAANAAIDRMFWNGWVK
jgi:hypothetical protein